MHDSKSQRRRLLALLSAMACALILVGCASLTNLLGRNDPPPAPASVVCEAFQPICWSAQDSDSTLAQIHEHNRVWRQLCPAATNPCAGVTNEP